MTQALLCLHCGAPVAGSNPSQFCCRGCVAVYELLRERGLEAYYAFRDKTGARHALTPVQLQTAGFDYLDDPEFLHLYAFAQGREMRFYLEGVHCAACVWLTEKLPEFESGVESLRLNLSSGVAWVRIQENGSFARAANELSRLGYAPHPVKQNESEGLRKKEDRRYLIRLGVAAMASGNIMLLAVALYAGADGRMAEVFRWVSFGLSLPVLLFSAVPFYRGAWASLRKRQLSIDVPIVLGLLVGFLASIVNLALGSAHIYFDSISTLVFLLLSTRYLLRKVHQHALNSSQLMHFLAPSKAKRKCGLDNYEEVRTEALRQGDVIRVLPGECFAVDGIVLKGESAVDNALLTGESELQLILVGARVHAGTRNWQAPVEVQVISSGASTRLGKILDAMEEGLVRKAPIVSYLDRVGQGFIGAVLVLTVVGFFLGLSVSLSEGINRALAVAIVVCPCTFALATPLAMSIAMSRCAKNGLLVKGADVIERLSQVKSVFFDKTGTVTYGELRVLTWEPLAPEATPVLRALEAQSSHPVALAVLRHFEREGPSTDLPEVTGFEQKAGWGVTGEIGGVRYEVRRLRSVTASAVGVYRDSTLIGRLELLDRLRPDSRAAIDRLKEFGLSIYLLSGDSPEPVRAVAITLGLNEDQVFSQASPEEKNRIVQSSEKALMVGDGANDAISLASAFASVAVQGGMEMSMRAAGVYSSRPGISPLVPLVQIARETMSLIRRNLVFAVLYNVVGVAVALSGHLDPLFAAVLMPLSAATVLLSTIVGNRA